MTRHRARRALEVLGAIFLLLLVALVAAIGLAARQGFSARERPTAIESLVARSVRSLTVPASVRRLRNPLPPTGEVLARGRAHFADHCATCHGNDGSGDTEMGRGLYPPPPDLRLPATQGQSDGALYHAIQDGVLLTGMPAWGAKGDENDLGTWSLVAFIRHLPELTVEEIEEMEKLNPRGPAAWKQEQEDERFLQGDDRDTGTGDAP